MRFALIAYANPDQTLAQALAADLRQRGIDVWLADADDATIELQRGLAEALSRCTAFLTIVSPAAEASARLQTIIGLPLPLCKAAINVKAETIEKNLDWWLDSQDEGINLMPVEFYDLLAKARLFTRRHGGLLNTLPVLTLPWQQHVRTIAILIVIGFFLGNLLLVSASGDNFNESPTVGTSCKKVSYPRVSMLDVTKTDMFLVYPDAKIEFRGMASDRPVVRVYASQQGEEDVLLARKQADFADIMFSLSDYDLDTQYRGNRHGIYVEVKCHGFCYYFILLNDGSSCE